MFLDRQQHFVAVLPDAQRHEKRNRRGLFVEPNAHHRAVENEPDDRLVLQGACVPDVTIAFHLAPNSADRVFPHGAAEQSREGPAHPARVGPGEIGSGDQRISLFGAPLTGWNGRVLPIGSLAIRSIRRARGTRTVTGPATGAAPADDFYKRRDTTLRMSIFRRWRVRSQSDGAPRWPQRLLSVPASASVMPWSAPAAAHSAISIPGWSTPGIRLAR